MAGPLHESGPAASLLQSAVRLGGTLLGVLQVRSELLTTEVEQEIERGAKVLLLGFATLLASILGLLVAGFVVVIVFWDTHRIAAAVGVLTAFVATAVGCGLALRREVKNRPKFLGGSRDELARDIEHLRRRL
jgi:uncharacterized membrane protein YqjE